MDELKKTMAGMQKLSGQKHDVVFADLSMQVGTQVVKIQNTRQATWSQARDKISVWTKDGCTSGFSQSVETLKKWLAQEVSKKSTNKRDNTCDEGSNGSGDMGVASNEIAIPDASTAAQFQQWMRKQFDEHRRAICEDVHSVVRTAIVDPEDALVELVAKPTHDLEARAAKELAADPTDEIKDMAADILAGNADIDSDMRELIVEKLVANPTDEIKDRAAGQLVDDPDNIDSDIEERAVNMLVADPPEEIKDMAAERLAEDDDNIDDDMKRRIVDGLLANPTVAIRKEVAAALLAGAPGVRQEVLERWAVSILERSSLDVLKATYTRAKRARLSK